MQAARPACTRLEHSGRERRCVEDSTCVWERESPPEEGNEATPRLELGSGAFAELCLTTWLRRRGAFSGGHLGQRAGGGNRTRASTLGRSQATITSHPRA